jgi:hypothetical protein
MNRKETLKLARERRVGKNAKSNISYVSERHVNAIKYRKWQFSYAGAHNYAPRGGNSSLSSS